MSGTDAALGSFPVVGTREAAAAFALATGAAFDGRALPLTFPMRWLTGAAVRNAILTTLAGEVVVLVHESQAFDYRAPLVADTSYTLSLAARREAAPDRLVVTGEVAAGGVILAGVETVLRLLPLPPEPA